MRDFIACVVPARGGRETVALAAWDEAQARAALLRLGYRAVIWIE